jgi:uncharacterized protein (TIGR03435 family)
MVMFASIIAIVSPNYIDLPVVNETGLGGTYDFTFHWTPKQLLDRAHEGIGSSNQSGLTIFDALQSQLGLKLDRKNEPRPAVVIDYVDRMPEN